MQKLRKAFSQNIFVLLGFPSSKCLAKVKSLKYICAMKHYIGTIVSFPSVKVDVECLNVQGCGEGRSDLGLQTKLLLQCLNFSDWAGHSSFIQSSFCQPLLSFSQLIVLFDIFSWLVCSFPLHWVCSDCPIRPSITPQVNPHLAGFPCSHLRLFAVQTFLSSCITLRKGQSGRGQQNSVFSLLCRIPMEDPTKWIWSLKQVDHKHMYKVSVCQGKKQLTISCVRNHLGKAAFGNRTGSRNSISLSNTGYCQKSARKRKTIT